MQDIENVLKLFKNENNINFYMFLRSRPSARAIKLYLEGLTRRSSDRVKEADKAAKHPSAHNETFDKKVRAAIGYSMSESKDRVIKELNRLKNKSDATWKSIEKAAKMPKKEILKHYGIE